MAHNSEIKHVIIPFSQEVSVVKPEPGWYCAIKNKNVSAYLCSGEPADSLNNSNHQHVANSWRESEMDPLLMYDYNDACCEFE